MEVNFNSIVYFGKGILLATSCLMNLMIHAAMFTTSCSLSVIYLDAVLIPLFLPFGEAKQKNESSQCRLTHIFVIC